MANVGVSAIKLIDSDGDALDDGEGKLNVNATLVAGALIDIGDVEVKGHAAITGGSNLTVSDTTAEEINGDSTSIPCKHIDIVAGIANTGIIWIGSSNVVANRGVPLYAGDVYSIDIENANLVYAIATVDNEDLYFVYYN